MPKAEVGTPKWLGNKMKSKGLQKLRWFCQMCEKQCRDENGFKCHTSSESHQRQLLLFADNPHRYLDDFSRDFKNGYVELIRRRYGTKRVNANQVYQEYISDKNHLHMNATKWLSLTSFVKWLGREGICTVDETEKGWFVTWIDRDPETIARQEALAKKEKMDKDDSERMLDFIQKQVQRAAADGKSTEPEYSELNRSNEEEKITLKLNPSTASTTPSISKPTLAALTASSSSSSVFKVPPRRAESVKSFSSSTSSSSVGKRKSALEELREEEERYKEKKTKEMDNWLLEGITVKVITKALGDKYYKQKGLVLKLIDKYTALVKMNETGTKLKLDQEHLETVIPAAGKHVKILNGHMRGAQAQVLSVDIDDYSLTLKVTSGTYAGQTLRRVNYEHVSKIDTTTQQQQ